MHSESESSPFFKTWAAWYWLVGITLLVKIGLLWWLTTSFKG